MEPPLSPPCHTLTLLPADKYLQVTCRVQPPTGGLSGNGDSGAFPAAAADVRDAGAAAASAIPVDSPPYKQHRNFRDHMLPARSGARFQNFR
ncbi:hypothetical protein XELAEV_18000188mg [Xenopus laevis]|uniref:Uncharacterized protein n=1 Tax=Xenopus laevis TaxID=8355 RepID=A0A974GYW0_XENLA|nr:hypothetical protein XELAEV_18000188mg [Xenopus laevis]